MLKIKDYLILKDIEFWLEKERDNLIRENNGYSNNRITEIEKYLVGLKKILDKLKNED